MRKIIAETTEPSLSTTAESAEKTGDWLDLKKIAEVEVSSENPEYPIENVFQADAPAGWRASKKGQQTIRLFFDQPFDVKRIRLCFVEPDLERTHEFALSWAPSKPGPYHLIVRQQWNFNPQNSTEEIEDYQVNLHGVRALELVIRPDVGRGQALASLTRWAVA
jgi:hypothetical protein